MTSRRLRLETEQLLHSDHDHQLLEELLADVERLQVVIGDLRWPASPRWPGCCCRRRGGWTARAHTWKEARTGIPYGLLYVAKQLGW